MDKHSSAEERDLSSPAITYCDDVISNSARKKYKTKLIRESPDTLRADLMHTNERKIKADLVFYTEHPSAWHSALCSTFKDL